MKKTLFLLALVFALCLPIITKADFSDVASGHPCAEAIKYSQENNIVSGYSDGTFKPENKINRAEFTKIIIEATQVKEDIKGQNCFPDVKDEWFAKYVCTAKEKGIISGYSDGTFQPNQNISFVEAAKIINKAFEYNSEQADDIWYKNYVNDLSINQAIPQTIDELNKEIARSEFVEIIWRLKARKYNLVSMVYFDQNNELRLNLGNGYLKDKKNAYFNLKVIDGANAATFEVVGDVYAKDRKNVYYGYNIIENADPKTFRVFVNTELDHYAKDKNNIYRSGKVIEDADLATFSHLKSFYAKDKNHAYFMYDIIKDADPVNFEALCDFYAKDENNVYSRGSILEDADPSTFEYLGNHFSKDKNNVYIDNKILEDTDPSTFKYIDLTYAKDKNNVYSLHKIIQDADVETFEYLGRDYAKDKNNVYYFMGRILKDADLVTFEYLGNGFAKDKNSVYSSGNLTESKIQGADPATFEIMNDSYAKDKNNAYFSGKVIEEADSASFEIVDEFYAKDKNHVYYGPITMDINPKTFRP